MTKFWVTMTDTFLTGWGKAEGKYAKLVVRCETPEEAERVKAAAKCRSEMRYVYVKTAKPSYDDRFFQVTVRDYRDLDGAWKR